MEKEFVICLNCIDGRVQLPVINWITTYYDVKYVDMITFPGMDGIWASKNNVLNDLQEKIEFSKDGHDSDHVFIVGHHDCLANSVTDEIHKEQIVDAVKNIKERNLSCTVTGLWVDDGFKVHKVYSIN